MPASWRSAPRRRGRCSLPPRRQAGAPPRRATRPAGRRRSRGRRGRRPEGRTESRRAAWPRPRRSHASCRGVFRLRLCLPRWEPASASRSASARRAWCATESWTWTTGRGAGAGLDGRETAGDGVAVAVLTTTRGFVATGAADEPTTGASGVGTARRGLRRLGRLRGLRRLRGRRGESAGRVVGRRHRRAAGGPAGRRTGERGQAGAHRERIASEPQRRRPPGHHVPPFGVSRYVGRRTRVNTGEGGRRRSAATLPRMHLALLVLRHPSLDRVATRRLRAGRPTSPALRPGAGRSRGPSGSCIRCLAGLG